MRRLRKRHLKSVFAFLHSLSPLWQFAYFFKCKRTLVELNSLELYLISDREETSSLPRFSLFSINVILTVSYFSLNYRNRVSVEENTPPGTVVFQVRATDADYGNNSIITYSLLPSEYAEKFSIGASSGNITVIGKLDRETTREIILRFNATDGTFIVTSELFVFITDVNDNKPIFTSR